MHCPIKLHFFPSFSSQCIFPSNITTIYLERIVVSPTWPTTTATPAYSGGGNHSPRGTEETSSGGDSNQYGPRDNLPRHRTESHSRRIFSGSDSDLSYDPFLPSTANPG